MNAEEIRDLLGSSFPMSDLRTYLTDLGWEGRVTKAVPPYFAKTSNGRVYKTTHRFARIDDYSSLKLVKGAITSDEDYKAACKALKYGEDMDQWTCKPAGNGIRFEHFLEDDDEL